MDKDWNDVRFSFQCRSGLLDRLDALDAEDKASQVIVVTHVPVFREQQVDRPNDLLKSSAYFYNFTTGNALKAYRKITHVISGHTHRGTSGTVQGDDGHPIRLGVIASDYHAPDYVVLDIP